MLGIDEKNLFKDMVRGVISSGADYFESKALKKTARDEEDLKILELARQINKDKFDKSQTNLVNMRNLFSTFHETQRGQIQLANAERERLKAESDKLIVDERKKAIKQLRDSKALQAAFPIYKGDPEDPNFEEQKRRHQVGVDAQVSLALQAAEDGKWELVDEILSRISTNEADIAKKVVEEQKKAEAREAYRKSLDSATKADGTPLTDKEKETAMHLYDADEVKAGHSPIQQDVIESRKTEKEVVDLSATHAAMHAWIDKYVPADKQEEARDLYKIYELDDQNKDKYTTFDRVMRSWGLFPGYSGSTPSIEWTDDRQTVLEEAIKGIRNETMRKNAQTQFTLGNFDGANEILIDAGNKGMTAHIQRAEGLEAAKRGLISNYVGTAIYDKLLGKVSENRNPERRNTFFGAVADELQRLGATAEDASRDDDAYRDMATIAIVSVRDATWELVYPKAIQPYLMIANHQNVNRTVTQKDAAREAWDDAYDWLEKWHKDPETGHIDLGSETAQKYLIEHAFGAGYDLMEIMEKQRYSLNQYLNTHLQDLIDQADAMIKDGFDFGRISGIGREIAKLKTGGYAGDEFNAWNTKLMNLRATYFRIQAGLAQTDREIKNLQLIIPGHFTSNDALLETLRSTRRHAKDDLDGVVRTGRVMPSILIPDMPEGYNDMDDDAKAEARWKVAPGKLFSWGAYEYALNNFNDNKDIVRGMSSVERLVEASKEPRVMTGKVPDLHDNPKLIEAMKELESDEENELTPELIEKLDPIKRERELDIGQYFEIYRFNDKQLLQWWNKKPWGGKNIFDNWLDKGYSPQKAMELLHSNWILSTYFQPGNWRYKILIDDYAQKYGKRYGALRNGDQSSGSNSRLGRTR